MVKFMSVSVFVLAAVLLLVTMSKIPVAEGVTCSPAELSSCAAAITSSAPPSAICCSKLRQQTPCLCGYLKNPSLRQYVGSPNAKKVISSCKIATPKC